MRILSQDGKIDVPYEQMVINIDYANDRNIVACGTNCDNEDGCITIAKYSTEDKARNAMEMLQKTYSQILVIKEPEDGIKPNIKPNDWFLTPALPTQRIEIVDNFYFQFPSDDEVYVWQ